jgi:hypothetical protein
MPKWRDHLQVFIIGKSNKDTCLILPTFQGHRGQSLSGSVSRACFVTAGAIDNIDRKLHTYVPLGQLTRTPNFGPI